MKRIAKFEKVSLEEFMKDGAELKETNGCTFCFCRVYFIS